MLCLVLYIFFKFYLKSRVIPASEMDFETEFASIRHEKAQEEVYGPAKSGFKHSIRRIIHAV